MYQTQTLLEAYFFNTWEITLNILTPTQTHTQVLKCNETDLHHALTRRMLQVSCAKHGCSDVPKTCVCTGKDSAAAASAVVAVAAI